MEMLCDTQKSFGLLSITSKIQSLKLLSPFKNSWDRIIEKLLKSMIDACWIPDFLEPSKSITRPNFFFNAFI